MYKLSTLVAFIAITSAQAFAANPVQMFIDAGSGKQVTPVEALSSGKPTYKCNLTEMKVSKSGTSISLRNVKKKLSASDIEKQKAELDSRLDK
jgi:hypothetical protein